MSSWHVQGIPQQQLTPMRGTNHVMLALQAAIDPYPAAVIPDTNSSRVSVACVSARNFQNITSTRTSDAGSTPSDSHSETRPSVAHGVVRHAR